MSDEGKGREHLNKAMIDERLHFLPCGGHVESSRFRELTVPLEGMRIAYAAGVTWLVVAHTVRATG